MRLGRGSVVVLLLLAAPGAAQQPVSLEVDSFGSGDAVTVVRWVPGAAGSFDLVADDLSGVLADEILRDRWDGDPLLDVMATEEDDEQFLATGPGRITSMATRNVTLVVIPMNARYDVLAERDLAGAVSLQAVEHATLEPQRRSTDDPDDPLAPPRFEVRDVVQVTTGGRIHLQVRGDFLLYVWDAELLHEHDGGREAHRTGYRSGPGSTPLHRDDHFVHALIMVRNGTLHVEAPEGASMYGKSIDLRGAGVAQAGLGPRQDAAPHVVASLATPGGGPPRVLFSEAPSTSAAPPTLGFEDVQPLNLLWGVVAFVLSWPHVVGRRAWPQGSLWTRLRATRGLGYRRLAVAAESRHRFRTAAHWMGRSARWSRDPEHKMQHAIYLRMAGRPRQALRAHRQAEDSFRLDGVTHPLNAYEAARAAARLGLVQESLQWLLAAVREEAWLAGRAPFEPDLALLRGLPAFMDLRQAADPDGLLRP